MSAGPNIGVIVHLGYEAGGDTGDVEKYAPKINAYDNFVSLEIGTVSFFLNDLEDAVPTCSSHTPHEAVQPEDGPAEAGLVRCELCRPPAGRREAHCRARPV